MTARFAAEIDALPESALALPAADRERRIAELNAQLDQLERTEESLIERAIADGQDVLRRPAADPCAVLGVTIKTRTTKSEAA